MDGGVLEASFSPDAQFVIAGVFHSTNYGSKPLLSAGVPISRSSVFFPLFIHQTLLEAIFIIT